MARYCYSRLRNDGKSNGTHLFRTLASALGNDISAWENDKVKLHSVLQFCHETIFEPSERPTVYKKTGGLHLQVLFLTRNQAQNANTKKKRPSYKDTAIWAFSAGILNEEQFKQYISHL
jgi:hypothetical protein